METSLKSRIFKLLKKDEEFRHAVIGVLGLEDIRTAILSLEKAVTKLAEGQARLEAGYARLEDTVVKLAEGQARLMEAMAETRRDILEIRRELASTRSELGGLSDSVGAMSESIARRALREWLRENGLTVDRLAPIRVRRDGEEVEVNFYGRAVDRKGKRISIYAEAKSTVRAREIRDLARVAAEAEKMLGEGIKLMIAFRIYEDAYQAAEEEGIQIIEA